MSASPPWLSTLARIRADHNKRCSHIAASCSHSPSPAASNQLPWIESFLHRSLKNAQCISRTISTVPRNGIPACGPSVKPIVQDCIPTSYVLLFGNMIAASCERLAPGVDGIGCEQTCLSAQRFSPRGGTTVPCDLHCMLVTVPVWNCHGRLCKRARTPATSLNGVNLHTRTHLDESGMKRDCCAVPCPSFTWYVFFPVCAASSGNFTMEAWRRTTAHAPDLQHGSLKQGEHLPTLARMAR
jgi:hypothetical protein